MELDEDCRVVVQPLCAGVEQATVRLEPVARGEDGGGRLAGQVRITIGVGCRKVGQVRHDEIDLAWHRLEEVAVAHRHPVAEAVPPDVRTRERDRAPARVGREDVRVRGSVGNRHRDRACSRADVDDVGPNSIRSGRAQPAPAAPSFAAES